MTQLEPPRDVADLVPPELYAGLLGYPPGEAPAGRAAERALESRSWYSSHGGPWLSARSARVLSIGDERVDIEGGATLTSAELARRLRESVAVSVTVSAVSAGSAVDRESARRWSDDRPDAAYFLDRFGAAAAIWLGRWYAETIRLELAATDRAVGPAYSPGYDGWELADQPRLAQLLDPTQLPAGFRVHSSGMLEPKNTLLGLFPVGTDLGAIEAAWRRSRCSLCSMSGCVLRGVHPT